MKTSDDFVNKGAVWNYVVRVAAPAVSVMMYFCGTQA